MQGKARHSGMSIHRYIRTTTWHPISGRRAIISAPILRGPCFFPFFFFFGYSFRACTHTSCKYREYLQKDTSEIRPSSLTHCTFAFCTRVERLAAANTRRKGLEARASGREYERHGSLCRRVRVIAVQSMGKESIYRE